MAQTLANAKLRQRMQAAQRRDYRLNTSSLDLVVAYDAESLSIIDLTKA
jgi:hypothetical protein